MRWLCRWRPWCQHTDSNWQVSSLHRWVFWNFQAAPGILRALQKLYINEHLFNKTMYGFCTKVHWCAAFPLHSMKCEWIDSLTSYPCHKQSTWDSIWWLIFKCSQQFASGHVSFGKLLCFQCLPSWYPYISHAKILLKMIFRFQLWDMLVSWRVELLDTFSIYLWLPVTQVDLISELDARGPCFLRWKPLVIPRSSMV